MADSSETRTGARGESAAPAPDRVKILVVDDQPDNLLSCEAILESLGQEIIKAESGRQALRFLLEHDCAVILLDVMMPGMDGFETATLIRQRERSRFTPIIFLTALGKTEEHLFHGYDVGAVDYLFKPIVPEVLRSKVSVFVDLHRKNELLKRQAELLTDRNRDLEAALARACQAEEEVSVLNSHLERRVLALSALNRELEAFSYTVSHDLRAPLSRIAGFTQALMELYLDRLDERGRLYLGRIHNASQRMCQLVDDLLNLARLSRAEIRREPLDLTALARAIAAEVRGREPERQAEFIVPPDLAAHGDPPLLRVVLMNLLENAWKFTRKREPARIEVGSLQKDGATVFFVRDNGAGFDMSESGKLFNPFQRLHSETEFEGTGIGLATVDRIIRRHGGRIWAEAEPGRGATFYFTL